MGQGVSVANLVGNTLITGWGNPADSLQSCSAVIMANPGTGAAGLYHFPAGNIDEDAGSRNVLTQMRDNVRPTEAYIAYGVVDMMDPAAGQRIAPVDPYNMRLREYVLRLLPLNSRLRRFPANRRIASVSLNIAGQIQIGDRAPANITDLRNRNAGAFGFGRVYWR